MNGNWDPLLKITIMVFFGAIWLLTSLFNRESKITPAVRPVGPRPTPPGPGPGLAPRPGEPTLRWASPTNAPAATRRVPIGDDDILIIPADGPRIAQRPGPRRPTRSKPAPTARKPEPAPSRPKLAGVSQNVNQQLSKSPLGLAPLTSTPPSTSTRPSKALGPRPAGGSGSILAAALADPTRLREAFVLNEILQPPLALRRRGKVGR